MEIVNKHVEASYDVLDKFEAGVELTGEEAKAVLAGRVNLTRSYVRERDGELFWINGIIYTGGEGESRNRKLLVHKKQIIGLQTKMAGKKLTLVPTKIYNRAYLVKLEFGLCRALSKHGKREKLKKRDLERETERALKEFNR